MKRWIVTLTLGAAFAVAGLQAQPKPKSQKELEALQAMFGAQDPDSRIKAAENVITNFADTDFRAIALLFEADSYERKGDGLKAIVFAEQSLQADPKQYQAMLMLARGYVMQTRENDLDKEDKLAKAEKYANQAIATITAAPKPNPQLTDEQWTQEKKDVTAQANESLGLAAMKRKKFDAAAASFQKAIENMSAPNGALQVRLAAAYNQAGKYDQALAALDKVSADPNAPASVKQVAQAERVRAMQGKKALPANGAPAAPAAGTPPPAA